MEEEQEQRTLNGFICHVRKTQQGQKEFGAKLAREDEAVYMIEPEDS